MGNSRILLAHQPLRHSDLHFILIGLLLGDNCVYWRKSDTPIVVIFASFVQEAHSCLVSLRQNCDAMPKAGTLAFIYKWSVSVVLSCYKWSTAWRLIPVQLLTSILNLDKCSGQRASLLIQSVMLEIYFNTSPLVQISNHSLPSSAGAVILSTGERGTLFGWYHMRTLSF